MMANPHTEACTVQTWKHQKSVGGKWNQMVSDRISLKISSMIILVYLPVDVPKKFKKKKKKKSL